MQGWKEKLLSQVGKEVSLCKDIEAMIHKFLWVKEMLRKSTGLNGVHYVPQN